MKSGPHSSPHDSSPHDSQTRSHKGVRSWWWIGVLLFGLFTIAGTFFYLFKNKEDLVSPKFGPLVESIYGLGTVVPTQSHQIKSAINQLVTEIYVREGDAVLAHSPLLRLGESGIQRAPFSGTITSVPLKKGEMLFPSAVAAQLVDLKNLKIEVSLEQQSVIRIRPQQPAVISFESLRGQKLESKVASVFPRDNQFMVTIPLDPTPEGILPGMTADVAIEVGRKQNALTIPIRSVSAGHVTVQRDGTKIKIPVKLGIMDDEWAEVIDGELRSTDQVLLRKK